MDFASSIQRATAWRSSVTRAIAEQALATARAFLHERLGVSLHSEKTRIVHITNGFELVAPRKATYELDMPNEALDASTSTSASPLSVRSPAWMSRTLMRKTSGQKYWLTTSRRWARLRRAIA